MAEKDFIEMIRYLRHQEAVMLFGKYAIINEDEFEQVAQFLESEYHQECYEYPGNAPEFDKGAAIWAAELVHVAAQLLLNRQQTMDEIDESLQAYSGELNASAHLSADLSLRFLPRIIDKLQLIDPEDELVSKLDGILSQWPYSAIGRIKEAQVDLDLIITDQNLLSLYADRVLEKGRIQDVVHQSIQQQLLASLGMYGRDLLNSTDFEKTKEWRVEKN